MAPWAIEWIAWSTLLLSCTAGGLLGKKELKRSENAHFDYVILGGGTAGLVVASRLSEDSSVSVAVIEAGDFENNNPNVTNPTALGLAKDTRVDWQYESVPQIFGGNQSLIWSAGKGLGGSSLINGKFFRKYNNANSDIRHQE